MILQEFTASHRKKKLDFLYVGPEIASLRKCIEEMEAQYAEFMRDGKLVAEIKVPPQLSYTMCYMSLIAHAGMGKNAQCETRAQAMFPMKDLILNMEMADFCYPLKSSILMFLQNIYLDIEKEIGEDFIKLIWELIAHLIDDLKRFNEVMTRQKRGSKMPRKPVEADPLEDAEDPGKKRVKTVDVNQDFYIESNFGRFHITELM